MTNGVVFCAPPVASAIPALTKCKHVAWVVIVVVFNGAPSTANGYSTARTGWRRHPPSKGHRMIRVAQTKSYALEPANNK
uniref:Secreted protein n=1 Tax=Steinernema glaseri TaxID=37863 RepID=A0A1I7YYM8_9BILA